jgi:FAD:protein FMN transferase
VTRRARLGGVALVLALAALAGVRWLRSGSAERVHELTGATMGTSFRVLVAGPLSEAELEQTRVVIEERLGRIERLMSTYDTASEVSRLNRHASTAPFPVDAEIMEVLVMARGVAERSGGAFDITVGPLVEAWGFGAGGGIDGATRPRPSEAELDRLREVIGYEGIVLDPAARIVSKAAPELRVDLSGIAKGYAADVVSDALEALGRSDFLVEVGGELSARGTRAGRPWRVGIERPGDAPGLWGTVDLAREGIATSGDTRDYHEEDGVRYAHIIDPRTGRPIVARGASVSVVHGSAATADAWATALTVLGPQEGFEVALREGVAAVFVYPDGGELTSRVTPALADRLTVVEPR